MKQLFLFTTLLLVISSSYFAQLSKGTFMPGVSINYNYNKSDRQDSLNGRYTNSTIRRNSISTNLNFGYFVKDNLAIGITGGYQRLTGKGNTINNNIYTINNNYINSSTQLENDFNIGLFARYYKMINSSKFGIFLQLNTQYVNGNIVTNQVNNINNNSYTINETKQKTNTFSIGLSPGIVYFINNKIGIETTFGNIGYSLSNAKILQKNTQTTRTNNEGFSVNVSSSTVQLGVRFYLGRSKSN